jgi:hypothetical protein
LAGLLSSVPFLDLQFLILEAAVAGEILLEGREELVQETGGLEMVLEQQH